MICRACGADHFPPCVTDTDDFDSVKARNLRHEIGGSQRSVTATDETPKQLSGKYWICDICSTSLELTTKYPTGGNTISLGKCDWCGDHGGTTPIVDFQESGDKSWE